MPPFPQRQDANAVVHLGELRFVYRPNPRLELGAGSSYLALAPARAAVVDDGAVRLLRVGPDLDLVWEPSRGGALFPHLYGVLDVSSVRVEPSITGTSADTADAVGKNGCCGMALPSTFGEKPIVI